MKGNWSWLIVAAPRAALLALAGAIGTLVALGVLTHDQAAACLDALRVLKL